MGWYGLYGENKREIAAELTSPYKGEHYSHKYIAKCWRGNCLWTVCERTTIKDGHKDRFIVLYIVQKWNDTWMYKDLDEQCHPYYYSCPLKYLKMSENSKANKDSEDSAIWREAVKRYHKRRKAG